MLLHSDVQLVRASYRELAKDADAMAEAFYRKLFQADPRLRFLFPEDLTTVRDHLLQMVFLAVRHIDRFDEVRHRLANLGMRHTAYGVSESDYDTFLAVVTETLCEQLNLRAGDPVLMAWSRFFRLVANTMVEGATRAEALA